MRLFHVFAKDAWDAREMLVSTHRSREAAEVWIAGNGYYSRSLCRIETRPAAGAVILGGEGEPMTRKIRPITVENDTDLQNTIYQVSAEAMFKVWASTRYLSVHIYGPTEDLELEGVVSMKVGPVQEINDEPPQEPES